MIVFAYYVLQLLSMILFVLASLKKASFVPRKLLALFLNC